MAFLDTYVDFACFLFGCCCFFFLYLIRTETLTAARLAHVDERRTTMREVGVQNPDRTHTQGLKITEENVLPLL